MWLAATNSFSLGSGLGTHCNRKRRLNAAVLRARLLLSPHSSHLDSAPGVSGSPWSPEVQIVEISKIFNARFSTLSISIKSPP